jgi:hypothetical protein
MPELAPGTQLFTWLLVNAKYILGTEANWYRYVFRS